MSVSSQSTTVLGLLHRAISLQGIRKLDSMFVTELRKHFPARIPEWVNAVTLAVWGAYIIAHPEIFLLPPYSGLETLKWLDIPAPAFWGLLAFTVGWVRFGALLINGTYSRTPMVRLIASAVSAFVWSQILIGMWINEMPNASIVMYGGAVVMDLISAYRASRDVAIAEATRRMAKQGAISRDGASGDFSVSMG